MSASDSNLGEYQLRAILRQLIHEIRQPLSGIESLSYYLGLVLGDDPEMCGHCDRLRRLVHQANWSLEDAAFAACTLTRPFDIVSINEALRELSDNHASHDDRVIGLELDEDAPVVALPGGACGRILEHLLAVFRDLSLAEVLPVFTTRSGDNGIHLEVSGELRDPYAGDLLRLIDPPGGVGGMRRYIHSLGGRWSAAAAEGRLSLELWLPAHGNRLDEVEIAGADAQVGSEV